MRIGTYYYPEQWPREQWKRDFETMKSMGLQIVHMAEFAWGTIEPSEGKYQLDWIDECIGLAEAAGMQVILCTPTAVLPVWMVERDPSVLLTERRFGGRRHANHVHPLVAERSKLVARAMAERFGNRKSVIGWQIDNELGAHFDQSERTHAAFRAWVRDKYKTIDEVNRAWGCGFWNTFYTDFSQIKFPSRRDPEYRNQHECLDASRFWSWTFAQYVKLQADEIRRRSPGRWVTTNFMTFHPDADPGDFQDIFDLWSWDTYPITGWGGDFKDERFRIADPASVGYMHDQMRGYSGRWALMEVQPGQVNWTGVPVQTMPGAVRQLLWQAFAHRSEFVTVYRFRRPRVGIEQFHDGLVDWDGVTPMRGGREFAQVITELKKLHDVVGVELASLTDKQTVSILHDHDQLWYYQSLPQARRFDYVGICRRWHRVSEELAQGVRVTTTIDGAQDTDVLIVPAKQMIEASTIKGLEKFARDGGHVIITGRTGIFDRNGHAWEAKLAEPIHGLIGAAVTGYDSLPERTFGSVDMDGASHAWGMWGDQLEPHEGTAVWARYSDQFYAGTPAVTHRTLGRGSVTYVGPVDSDSLASAVLEKVLKLAGVETLKLEPNTRVHRVGPVTVFANANPRPVVAPAPAGAEFIIGQRRVDAAGVCVWK
ncbi:MAG: beta-galactosidase [Tepidisphaeraceae bacterium]